MQLGQAAHQGQPDAEAAVRAVEVALALHERLEYAADQVRRHAGAVVGDGEYRLVALLRHAHGDGSARGSVFEGVADEVGDDLLDAGEVRVHPDRRQLAPHVVATQSARPPPAC